MWNCTATLNIELSTGKPLDSNYGITVSKQLLDDKYRMLYVSMRYGTETALSELSAVNVCKMQAYITSQFMLLCRCTLVV